MLTPSYHNTVTKTRKLTLVWLCLLNLKPGLWNEKCYQFFIQCPFLICNLCQGPIRHQLCHSSLLGSLQLSLSLIPSLFSCLITFDKYHCHLVECLVFILLKPPQKWCYTLSASCIRWGEIWCKSGLLLVFLTSITCLHRYLIAIIILSHYNNRYAVRPQSYAPETLILVLTSSWIFCTVVVCVVFAHLFSLVLLSV